MYIFLIVCGSLRPPDHQLTTGVFSVEFAEENKLRSMIAFACAARMGDMGDIFVKSMGDPAICMTSIGDRGILCASVKLLRQKNF